MKLQRQIDKTQSFSVESSMLRLVTFNAQASYPASTALSASASVDGAAGAAGAPKGAREAAGAAPDTAAAAAADFGTVSYTFLKTEETCCILNLDLVLPQQKSC